MRSGVWRSLSFFSILLWASLAFAQGAKISGNPGETERDRPQERARWFMRGRTVDGHPAAQQLHRAFNQKLANRALHAQARVQSGTQDSSATSAPRPLFSPQPAGGPVWTPLGPAPTATAAFASSQQDYGPAVGRVTAVVVDQGDSSGNTVYVGGASGGLWRSTNAVSASRACNTNGVCTAPVTWTPLTDGQATLTVGSIALQPGNSSLILVGTGEANNSADSYYGLGILRSTDAGATWSLISKTADNAFDFHGLGFTHIAFSTDNHNVVVATAAAASGGIVVGAETGGVSARGIYYSIDAGVTWLRATVADPGGVTPDAGSANAVLYDPQQQKFYANLRYHGIYSSADGASWTRLPSQPAGITLANCSSISNSSCPLYRAEMALVPGRDELYVWIIDNQENDRGIYRTPDGGQTWTAISTAGIDTCGDGANNGCGSGKTSQATYNISLAALPNGAAATDLYAGGVNEYKCSINPVTNPTCDPSSGGKAFLNLTHVYGCGPVANIAHVHPDEHGIDFLGNDVTGAFFAAHPSFDPPVFFGNDGGVYRVSHNSSLASGTCPVGLPPSPFDNLNASTNFSMIQFVGFSHHPSDAATLVGGTQDNGSPAVSGAAPSSGAWLAVNNGDGGFNAINPLNPSEWFTSNPAPLTAGGGIQHCTSGISCTFQNFFSVVTQAQIGGDYSAFYTFFMLDPQASGRMLVASCRVWRGNSDGSGSDWSVNSSGGNPLTSNLDDPLSGGSCADPTTSPVFMVNTIAAGGPCNGACDPGITPGSSTGGGSQTVWTGMEGVADATSAASACPSASPCGGQVWRSLAADSGPATWSEVSGLNNGVSAACTASPSACNINPLHYTISGIALAPADATGRTAYVTVMGFGVGHVFKTTDAGATWSRLDGDPNGAGLPDAPADAVVADPPIPGLVYVGTDVGVFKSTGDGNWTELGPSSGAGSLPNVAITQLKIYNRPSDSVPLRLRASTYGRGLWEIPISPVPGYNLTVANPTLYAFAGHTANYSGSITTFNGYTSSINLTCTSGATSPPSICPTSGSPVTIPAPATSGAFAVTVGNPVVADFSFNLAAVGSDPKGLTTQAPVTLHSVDFSMGSVPSSSVGVGNSADVSFTVSPQGQFTGNVSLACSGQPAGTSCIFSPPVVSLTPGAAATVRLTISTSSSTAVGNYTVTITGAASLGADTLPHSTSMTMVVGTATFSTSGNTISPTPAKSGSLLTATVTVTANGSYAGTLSVACAIQSTAGDNLSTCRLDGSSSPVVIALAASTAHSFALTVNTAGAPAGNASVVVTATDQANHASSSAAFNYSLMDYSLSLGTVGALAPGSSTSVSMTLAALNGFASTIAASCAPPSPLACALSPAGPFAIGGTTGNASASVTVSAPANTTPSNYSVTIDTNDAATPSLTHNRTLTFAVQDFQVGAIANTETVKAGGTPTPHVITISGLGGFSGLVALACSSGLPALATCSFSAQNVGAGGSSTLTIQTTAPSVSALHPPAGRPSTPLYALWMTLPGMFLGMIGIGVRSRRFWHSLLWPTNLCPTRPGVCSPAGTYAGSPGRQPWVDALPRIPSPVGTARTLWHTWRRYILLTVVGASLIVLISCGGGGGSATTPTPPVPKPGTPAGTYTVMVTGTSSVGSASITRTIPITLTVQ